MVNVKDNHLLCPLCENARDDQPHLLECTELQSRMKTEELSKGKVEYKDIFESVDRQKEAVQLILQLLNIREEQVDENLVKKNNPSNLSDEMLMDSDNLLHSIVHCSFGK